MKKQHKVKPITPDEVTSGRKIPDEVIVAFNTLIEKNWDGERSVIGQRDAIDEILRNFSGRIPPMTKDYIFDNHYLDVEGIFSNVGWKVTFDKPAYNETYEATFTFRIKF